jgi:hypothetical protein
MPGDIAVAPSSFQVQCPADMRAHLDEAAEVGGVSVAEVVRLCVTAGLPVVRDALAITRSARDALATRLAGLPVDGA